MGDLWKKPPAGNNIEQFKEMTHLIKTQVKARKPGNAMKKDICGKSGVLCSEEKNIPEQN